MRWFVVFLLLANLVLYLWVAYGESPRPAHELPPPDIGRLRLLHEATPMVDADSPASASAAAVVPLDPPPLALDRRIEGLQRLELRMPADAAVDGVIELQVRLSERR
jgi:hypothetical protein